MQNLIDKLDSELAARGITKKPFTVTANGKTATVLAYNYREARRVVGNSAR